MSEFKLSIVIPVFGVEKFILHFLDSLLPQVNNHVQLIFINDGCIDSSVNILKKYIKSMDCSNILMLSQENKGQSSARNYGISLSLGDYITFLDPDDLVKENYINTILENINSYDPDLIHINLSTFLDGTKKITQTYFLAENDDFCLNSNYVVKKIFNKNLWFSCIRVVKKDFIGKNFFPVGYIYEDMFAFPKIYEKIKTIKNINDDLVLYRIHPTSSSRKKSPTLLFSPEYGLKHYGNNDFYRDIYKSFLLIRLKNGIDILGFFKTLSWYRENISENKNSLSSQEKFYFFIIILKFKIIFLIKKTLKR